MFEAPQNGHGGKRRQTGQETAAELLPDHLSQHSGKPFRGLERNIANKPITDDHIDTALVDVIAFYVADEVEWAVPEQFCSLSYRVVTLDDLLADIEEPDRRALAVIERRDQRRSHQPELQVMNGLAVNIRAQVKHGGSSPSHVGELGRDSWPINAVDHLEYKARCRHERAGIASAHAAISAPFLDQVERHPHGGIPLATHGLGGRFIHTNHLRGVTHLETLRNGLINRLTCQREPDILLATYQRAVRIGHAPQKGQHTREVLQEVGLDQAQIDALIQSGAAQVS